MFRGGSGGKPGVFPWMFRGGFRVVWESFGGCSRVVWGLFWINIGSHNWTYNLSSFKRPSFSDEEDDDDYPKRVSPEPSTEKELVWGMLVGGYGAFTHTTPDD